METRIIHPDEVASERREIVPAHESAPVSFLSLPYEVRESIYEYLFVHAIIIIFYPGDSASLVHRSLEWPDNASPLGVCKFTAITYANKQISREAFDVLYRELKLEVWMDPGRSRQDRKTSASGIVAPLRLPSHIRQRLRRVNFTSGGQACTQRYQYGHSAPYTPFPFSATPNLRIFIAQFRLSVDLAQLTTKTETGSATNHRQNMVSCYAPGVLCTRECSKLAAYQALASSERLTFWRDLGLTQCASLLDRILSVNRGRWLGQLIQPHVYGVSSRDPEIIVRPDREFSSQETGHEEASPLSEFRSTATDAFSRLGVPSSCAIVAEIEIVILHLVEVDETAISATEAGEETDEENSLSWDDTFYDLRCCEDFVEKIAVAIDVRQQKIIGQRLIGRGDKMFSAFDSIYPKYTARG